MLADDLWHIPRTEMTFARLLGSPSHVPLSAHLNIKNYDNLEVFTTSLWRQSLNLRKLQRPLVIVRSPRVKKVLNFLVWTCNLFFWSELQEFQKIFLDKSGYCGHYAHLLPYSEREVLRASKTPADFTPGKQECAREKTKNVIETVSAGSQESFICRPRAFHLTFPTQSRA